MTHELLTNRFLERCTLHQIKGSELGTEIRGEAKIKGSELGTENRGSEH